MLKNGYYYIPTDVSQSYAGYLIVAGYEESGGIIRKTQYLIQDRGVKWRTVSGTLASPTFGEWCVGVTNSELIEYIKVTTFSGTISVISGSSAAATVPINTPAGYKPVLAVISDTKKAKILPRSCYVSSNTAVTVYVDNLDGSNYTGDIFINVLFTRAL